MLENRASAERSRKRKKAFVEELELKLSAALLKKDSLEQKLQLVHRHVQDCEACAKAALATRRTEGPKHDTQHEHSHYEYYNISAEGEGNQSKSGGSAESWTRQTLSRGAAARQGRGVTLPPNPLPVRTFK
jgi:hypothetical protein